MAFTLRTAKKGTGNCTIRNGISSAASVLIVVFLYSGPLVHALPLRVKSPHPRSHRPLLHKALNKRPTSAAALRRAHTSATPLIPRLHDTTGCLDNRLYRVNKHPTACQTELYNRFDNRFDNRLYRVNGALLKSAQCRQRLKPSGR